MIDYSALLFDPVFGELGVQATLIASGTAGEVELTVIDETRRKIQASNGVEVRSVDPAAVVRVPELIAKGVARELWRNSVLTFNGKNWSIRNYDTLGSPNGEDLGLVRFLLTIVELQ
jgi:anti-sigma factor RsiW